MGNDRVDLSGLARVAIYRQDVEVVTGRSVYYARSVMQRIRELHGKRKDQLISVSELADYLGLPVEDVIDQLGLRK